MTNRAIIVITGCTASGKSAAALKIAKDINGVIINADSRQVYKEISIGTAKPVPEKVEGKVLIIDNIKHYLFSYVSVKEEYNLYKYQKDVFSLLDILPKETTPILVGGTGLYIDSVVYNYKLKINREKKLDMNLDSLAISKLQELVDKEEFEKLNESDRQNPRRLMHVISHGLPSIKKGKPLIHKYYFLDIDRDMLRKNIRFRVEEMLREGLIEENEMIRSKGLIGYSAINTIGYKEFNGYFEGNKSIDEVKEEIITHTNQYAKRQRTWFRKNKEIIYVKDYKEILNSLDTHLESIYPIL